MFPQLSQISVACKRSCDITEAMLRTRKCHRTWVELLAVVTALSKAFFVM